MSNDFDHLLKETNEVISYLLYVLFKKSFNESAVPDDWKCANVIPIFRLVTLISQSSQLFEKKIIRVHFLEEKLFDW